MQWGERSDAAAENRRIGGRRRDGGTKEAATSSWKRQLGC